MSHVFSPIVFFWRPVELTEVLFDWPRKLSVDRLMELVHKPVYHYYEEGGTRYDHSPRLRAAVVEHPNATEAVFRAAAEVGIRRKCYRTLYAVALRTKSKELARTIVDSLDFSAREARDVLFRLYHRNLLPSAPKEIISERRKNQERA